MRIALLLSLALVSCSTVTPASTGNGKEVYRYVNTLDFENNNSLDQVTVIGYDDGNMGEATRLDVTIGSAILTLRDPYDGTAGGAMYNPGVAIPMARSS